MLRLNGDLSKNIYLKKNITSVTSHLYLDNQYNPPNNLLTKCYYKVAKIRNIGSVRNVSLNVNIGTRSALKQM